jgi:threonine dehydrogenase-like Zn-dependent dehydrogenase
MQALYFKKSLTFKKNLPSIVKPGECRIRVLLAGICSTDLEITKGYMGFSGIPGHEFVGVVEQSDDSDWIGKRVVGEINAACGDCCFCIRGMKNHCARRTVLGILGRDGSFAESLSLPIQNLHPLPNEISDEEAVFVEPLAAAFRILEQLPLRSDERVTLLGDGKLGLLIAQALKGTCRLVVVGSHPERRSLLEKWGIDFLSVREAEPLRALSDIVIDATGSPKGFDFAQERVRPGGTIVVKTTCAGKPKIDLARVVINEITVIGSRCGPFPPAIKALRERKVDTHSLISEVYPLRKGKEALRRAAEKGALKILLRP